MVPIFKCPSVQWRPSDYEIGTVIQKKTLQHFHVSIALAIVAPDLVDLAPRVQACVSKLPFVVDRETCYHILLRSAGVRISDKPDQIQEDGELGCSCPLYTLPSDLTNIATHIKVNPHLLFT